MGDNDRENSSEKRRRISDLAKYSDIARPVPVAGGVHSLGGRSGEPVSGCNGGPPPAAAAAAAATLFSAWCRCRCVCACACVCVWA